MTVPVLPRLMVTGLLLCLHAGAARAADPPAHGDHGSGVFWQVLADRLEWQDAGPGPAFHWDLHAWAGTDSNRVLLRAEGERLDGETEDNQVELLWQRPVTAFWDLVAGLRQDFAPVENRSYLALGITGLAPQWVHLEATAYLGERGQSGVGVEAGRQLLLTNRLILDASVEAVAWGRDDEVNGIGNGLSKMEAGIRVRYEIRREIAPYLGVEWSGKLGDTADLARESGSEVRDLRIVAGLRVWF